MVSIKVKFRKSKKEKEAGTLFFQVICCRKVRIVSSSMKVFAIEWNPSTQRVIINPAMSEERKAYLRSVAENLSLELDIFQTIVQKLMMKCDCTAIRIIELYREWRVCEYFYPFVRKRIKELESEKRYKTAAAYRCTIQVFEKFRKGEDIKIGDFDVETLKRFERYLLERNVSMNTISFYMRVLRANYNRAVAMGLCTQQFPFRNVYTGISKTVKRAVDEQVVFRLQELDLSMQPGLSYARDLFLFSFYTRGMAFVDIALLKPENIVNGVLHYTRSKTGQQLAVKLEECMQVIIDRYANSDSIYLFPIIKQTQYWYKQYTSALCLHNKRLRIISEKLGLSKRLTSYVARHTWATIAKNKGIPLRVISEGMGHCNENTTRIYLASLDSMVIDKANLLVISGLETFPGQNIELNGII